MFRSLLWKEWREQRWKAAFGAVVLGAFAAIGLKTRIMPDGQVLLFGFILSTFLFPLFIGIGLVPAEREERTLPYLLKIPAPSWISLATKLLVGGLTLSLPILCICLVYALVGWNREVENWRILTAGPVFWGVSLEVLIWFTAFGIRQHRQDTAAILSLGVLMSWLFILILCGAVRNSEEWIWISRILYVLPLGFGRSPDWIFHIPNLWLYGLIKGTTLALLCFWMFRRFTIVRSARS
ncbi:MAG: hypothetical protein KC964_04170 [Candidatus Omnitrophica bacterium]|nr:hypothetical protein [Candidatus Omnitrophota bacterium]